MTQFVSVCRQLWIRPQGSSRVGPPAGETICDMASRNSIFSFLRFQAGRTISTNFALREVSTAAYNGQQSRHLRPIVAVVEHGVWPMDFNDNKNR
jgi:hypothetical protein